MKNVFALALIVYAAVWGVGAGSTSASESSPRAAWSDTAFPAHVLLAKRAASSGRTSSTLTVNNVRHHAHKKYTRVVLDITGRVNVKQSKEGSKAKISLTNIKLSQRARQQIKKQAFPRAIVIAQGDKQSVSIVLDLRVLKKYKVLTLRQPERIVVDLFYAQKTPGVTAQSQTRPSQPSKATRPRAAQSSRPPSKTPKDVLIVIDPGHGGKDPGTIGRKGTREKTIALQVSKTLQDLIQQRLKLTVRLTRTKDTFLDLEDRVAFANRKKADLFISVHVNSHAKRSIQGIEIYHFGKASDPRALAVAARENGMKLESDAPPWQFIIADKLNDQKIEASRNFAWTTRSTLVETLQKGYRIKDHGVKTAPFYVLRFTTMPSILVEMGYMSNPTEESRLGTNPFQKRLAEGIYQGIRSYLEEL